MGGYNGWEGDGGGEAIADVELLTLMNINQPFSACSWCQKKMTPLPQPLDGTTFDYLPLSRFLDNRRLQGPGFKKPHWSFTWDRFLLCGGADDNYEVQSRCRWWDQQSDSWLGEERYPLHQHF